MPKISELPYKLPNQLDLVPIVDIDTQTTKRTTIADIRGDAYVRTTYFEGTSTVSGTVQIPTGGIYIYDNWQEGVDLITSEIDSYGKPTFKTPKNSSGEDITATITSINSTSTFSYQLSSNPTTTIAVIYPYRVLYWQYDYNYSLDDAFNIEYVIDDILQVSKKTGEPTGYVIAGGVAVPTISAGVVTWNGTDELFLRGNLYSKADYSIDASSLADGKYFIYWIDNGLNDITLTSSTLSWAFDNTKVFVAILYKTNGVYKLGEERHGCTMDASTHERDHLVYGSVMENGGFDITCNDTSITISTGKFWDEDLPIVIPQHTSVAMSYFTGTLYQRTDSSAFRYYRPNSGSETPQYLLNNVLTDIPVGNFGLYWIVATHWTNPIKITSVLHTEQYPTVHDASGGFFNTDIRTIINNNGVGAAEFRLLGCVITQNIGGVNKYIEKYDLRNTSPVIRQSLNHDDEVRFEDVYVGDVTGSVLGQTHSLKTMLTNIDKSLAEAVYYPQSYTISGWTLLAGSTLSLQTRDLSTAGSLRFTEVSNNATVTLSFTGVTSFNKIDASILYAGGGSHLLTISLVGQNGKPNLQLYTFGTGGTYPLYTQFYSPLIEIATPSDYIGADGLVQYRIVHSNNAIGTHILNIDKLALIKSSVGITNGIPLVSAPTTATSIGTAGTAAYDSTYFYMCIATNSWRRVQLTTW